MIHYSYHKIKPVGVNNCIQHIINYFLIKILYFSRQSSCYTVIFFVFYTDIMNCLNLSKFLIEVIILIIFKNIGVITKSIKLQLQSVLYRSLLQVLIDLINIFFQCTINKCSFFIIWLRKYKINCTSIRLVYI